MRAKLLEAVQLRISSYNTFEVNNALADVRDMIEDWPLPADPAVSSNPFLGGALPVSDVAQQVRSVALLVCAQWAENGFPHARLIAKDIDEGFAKRDTLFPLPADPASGEGADEAREPYQARADKWLLACFGTEIARDKIERNHRFIEEALELVQACGCTQSEAHQIVNYVYARPTGEIGQEIGGVMNTLAALCCAHDFDMDVEADREIERCWGKLEKIRAKQAAKPKHSPLPAHIATDPRDAETAVLRAALEKTKGAMTCAAYTLRNMPVDTPYTQHAWKDAVELEIALAALSDLKAPTP